jgi:uncharacterized protein YjbI with pentapeptide repeats
LTGVDFTGAYLFMARFKGADLSGAVGLTEYQLSLACGMSDTKSSVKNCQMSDRE